MLETLSVFQWSILALAALCIGMSKTGVQGMMLLIVPYMAMAFGAKKSTGVILPMLCMADIMAVAYYKRIADWKVVAKLLPTALLGFLVALFVDKLVPAQGFRQLMGWTLALAMAVMIGAKYSERKTDGCIMVVFCPLRIARRFHHDDWQCCRTGHVSLSALDAQGEDGIHRH